MQTNEAQVVNMMALSLVDGSNADGGKPVLTKEDSGWDIWADSEE